MPRQKGKKKKGRIVRPGMEDAMKQKLTEQMNQKFTSLGIENLNLPTAPQTAADSDSALDASVYTYYSESVHQTEEQAAESLTQSSNLQQIQAQLEQAQQMEEESKELPLANRQILSSRVSESPEKIMFDQEVTKGAQQETKRGTKTNSARNTNSTSAFTARHSEDISLNEKSKKNKIEVLDQASIDTPRPAAADQSNQSKSQRNKKNKKEQREAQKQEEAKVTARQEQEDEQPAIEDGQFFDDFDNAFGDDNDVPILDMKKKESKPEDTKAEEPAVVEETPGQPEQEVAGQFFDDFDAAFGSDNDVPILEMKKETKQEQPKAAEPETPQQEDPKVAQPAAKPQAKVQQTPTEQQPLDAVTQSAASSQPPQSENQRVKPQPKEIDTQAAMTTRTTTSSSPSVVDNSAAVQMLGPQLSDRKSAATNSAAKPPRPPKKTVQQKSQSKPTMQPEAQSSTTQSFKAEPIVTQMITDTTKDIVSNQNNETQQLSQLPIKTPEPKQETVVAKQVEQGGPKKTTPTPRTDDNEKAEPAQQNQSEQGDDDDDEEDTSQGGGGGRWFLFTAVCAMAAGTFFYVKRNNIQNVNQFLQHAKIDAQGFRHQLQQVAQKARSKL